MMCKNNVDTLTDLVPIVISARQEFFNLQPDFHEVAGHWTRIKFRKILIYEIIFQTGKNIQSLFNTTSKTFHYDIESIHKAVSI